MKVQLGLVSEEYLTSMEVQLGLVSEEYLTFMKVQLGLVSEEYLTFTKVQLGLVSEEYLTFMKVQLGLVSEEYFIPYHVIAPPPSINFPSATTARETETHDLYDQSMVWTLWMPSLVCILEVHQYPIECVCWGRGVGAILLIDYLPNM
jgi:hypothetical protein